jgi:P27 family predicted phage terminase small subunit
MGRRGPATMPTQLRLLKGDHHKGRFNPLEPVVRDVLPVAPDDMADDVREIWDYTVAELEVMKIAAATDRDALICYCEAVIAHRKASAILARSPVLVKGEGTVLIRNPALLIQRDAAHTIRAFAQEFGLTPSARTRIQVEGRGTGGEQNNPFTAAAGG